MKGYIWKILGLLLILYSIIAGMLIPLKPGIEQSQPSRVQIPSDQVLLKIQGYNTHFQNDENRVWAKLSEEHAIEASSVSVINDNIIEAKFSFPASLPSNRKISFATLIVNNSTDGLCILPDGLILASETAVPFESENQQEWNDKIEVEYHSGMTFPYRNILVETIRNTYYHVPLWFAMMFIMLLSVIYAILYLRTKKMKYDLYSSSFVGVGVLFGILGLITGAIWAKHTWGAYWSWDIKQNSALLALLIYGAYFVLRSSFGDFDQRNKVSAVYNIFAFASLIPILYILPRLYDSLHPGSGGNPAMGGEDLDNTMRMIFYPAIIGWILIGIWLGSLHKRIKSLEFKILGN